MVVMMLGRVHRQLVAGEVVSIHLELIRDRDPVEIVDGDEFVTVELRVDPFELGPPEEVA